MQMFMVMCVHTAAASSGLRVIGAGQGRTGTESLRLALNALGVGPTYHMSQLLGIDASRHSRLLSKSSKSERVGPPRTRVNTASEGVLAMAAWLPRTTAGTGMSGPVVGCGCAATREAGAPTQWCAVPVWAQPVCPCASTSQRCSDASAEPASEAFRRRDKEAASRIA